MTQSNVPYPTGDLLFGLDVSHHNADSVIPWGAVGGSGPVSFLVHKASEGKYHDAKAQERVARARDLGAVVGIYDFWRADFEPDVQWATFHAVSEHAVCLGQGDLLPVLDFEHPDPITKRPKLNALDALNAKKWCDAAVQCYGGAILYISYWTWHDVGSPAWMLDFPMWIARYPGHQLATPEVPGGKPWRMWQYNVKPWSWSGGGFDLSNPAAWKIQSQAPGALDHNVATKPLPTIGAVAVIDLKDEPADPIDMRSIPFVTEIDWKQVEADQRAHELQRDFPGA